MTNVVWTYDSFENCYGINHKLKKYLKSMIIAWSTISPSNIFLKVDFVRKNSQE